MLGMPMLLSGVGTLETEVTKPLSAVEKVGRKSTVSTFRSAEGLKKRVEIPLFRPEHGCCGDVGGVSGTLQWLGSLLRP